MIADVDIACVGRWIKIWGSQDEKFPGWVLIILLWPARPVLLSLLAAQGSGLIYTVTDIWHQEHTHKVKPPPVNKLEIFHDWPTISVPSHANDHFLWTVKFLKYTGGPPAALYLRFKAWEKCWNYVLIQFGVMFQLWGPGQTDWPIFMTIIGPFPVIRAHTAS